MKEYTVRIVDKRKRTVLYEDIVQADNFFIAEEIVTQDAPLSVRAALLKNKAEYIVI